MVASRSHHGVWVLPGHRVRQPRWRPGARVCPDGSPAQRYLRATLVGARTPVRSAQITTDPAPLPPATTGERMTQLPGKMAQTVGNTLGVRTGIA